jgi:ankyrin repeat protein
MTTSIEQHRGAARLVALALTLASAGGVRAERRPPNPNAVRTAIELGDARAAFEELESTCLDVDYRFPRGETFVTVAAACLRRGCTGIVQRLASAGADLDAADADGWTPLMHALYRGNTETVALLASTMGARVNVKDRNGLTPLMLAAARKSRGFVEQLLKVGADVLLKSSEGDTAIDIARRLGDHALAALLGRAATRTPQMLVKPYRERKRPWPGCKRLLAPRPSPPARPAREPWEEHLQALRASKDPNDAIAAAALGCDQKTLYSLLDRRCGDVDHRPTARETHTSLTRLSLRKRFTPACRALLIRLVQDGAEVDREVGGNTPLTLAAARNDAESVRVLLRAGAHPDRTHGANGVTALFRAAEVGGNEAVRELLAGHAVAATKDARGRTAADEAFQRGYLSLGILLEIAASKPWHPPLAVKRPPMRPLTAPCLARQKQEAAKAEAARAREREREAAAQAARAEGERRAEAERRGEAERRSRASREAGAEAAREHAEARRARAEAERKTQAEADRKAQAEAAEQAKRAEARRKDEAELKEACARFEIRLDRMDVRKVPGGHDFKVYARVYNGARFALKVTVDWEVEGGCSARGQIRDHRVTGLAFGVPMGGGTCSVPAFSVSFRLARCERD